MVKAKRRANRNFLNLLIFIVIILIALLWNIPGGIKPTKDEAPGDEEKTQPHESTQADGARAAASLQPMDDAQANAPLRSLENLKQRDSAPPAFDLDIQHWHNKVGANVLFVEAHELPMLDVRVIFNAGAARDGDQPGTAQLTNAMLDEGTPTYTVDEIAKGFESVGAVFGNGSYRDMGVVSLRTLTEPEWLEKALALFSHIISEPEFPESTLSRLKKQMLVALQQEQQLPGKRISKAFFKALYQQHPYGIPPNGTTESIEKLSAQHLKAFHQRFYVGSNATIAIVGNVTREHAEKIADQVLSGLKKGAPAKPLPSVNTVSANTQHIAHPSTQTRIVLGGHGITRNDKNYYALYVGNEILGGHAFTSLLYEEVREKRGLSYSVNSGFTAMQATGPFRVQLQTKNENTRTALEVVRKTLNQFRNDGPTETQLEKAKTQRIAKFPLQTASNKSIVNQLGSIGFYGLPLDSLSKFPENIQNVTQQDVKAIFDEILNPESMLVLTVGEEPAPVSEPEPEVAAPEKPPATITPETTGANSPRPDSES